MKQTAFLQGSAALAMGATLAVFSLPCSAQDAAPEPRPLRVLETFQVPGQPSPATDVRWASSNSVFLARFHHGVAEVELRAGLPQRKQWVPDRETFGRFLNFTRLAASNSHLAVASHANDFTWRSLGPPPPDGMVPFERKKIDIIEDLDLNGDRLAVLGVPSTREGDHVSPQGVAWIGTFSARLADLKPLLRDVAGPAAPRLSSCALFGLGAVRFLPDGSIAVVPGFLPGAYLYSADGKLARTWTSAQTGLSTDCSGMNQEESGRLHTRPEEQVAWLNRHRILDDVLALPGGPGLLVRSFGPGDKVRWHLRVLRPSGVLVYEVPLAGDRPTDRLRGDVRNDRIVLLVSEHSFHKESRHSVGRLAVLEVPRELLVPEAQLLSGREGRKTQ